MPYYTTATGLAAHAEGFRTTASQPGEHVEGYASTLIAPVEGYAGVSNLTLEPWCTGGSFSTYGVQELRIAGGDGNAARIKIPNNFTYYMEFNIMAVAPDYSVGTWAFAACAQNTGTVVEGVGSICHKYDLYITYGWSSNGNGTGTYIYNSLPAAETAYYMRLDTDWSNDEIILSVYGTGTSYVPFYGTVQIVKLWAPTPADSSS